MALGDLLLLVVALALASWNRYGQMLPWEAQGLRAVPLLSFLAGSAVLASLLTIGMAPGLPRPTFARGLVIVGLSAVFTVFLVVGTRVWFSRSLLGVTFLAWGMLAMGHRAIRLRAPWTEPIVAVTDEKELAEDLEVAVHVQLGSVLDPRTEGEVALPPAGTTIALDLRAVLSERMAQFVSSCDVAGYNVRPLASVYEEHTGRVPLIHLAEGWEISAPLSRASPYLTGKRAFDVAAVIVTAPLWIVLGGAVGLFVRLASPGPAIFRQRRTGQNGEPFVMYKFRTMAVDAESAGPRFAARRDPRLIRGGGFLRASRLDEIPQLWNVLRGDMSLVGPRAEQVAFAAEFSERIPFYGLRHMIRPGITGWAQVNYRYADDLAETMEKLTYDLYYVKRMSPLLDLSILWKSVWTVLTGAGAR